MRQIIKLAVVILGCTLAIGAPKAFADIVLGGACSLLGQSAMTTDETQVAICLCDAANCTKTGTAMHWKTPGPEIQTSSSTGTYLPWPNPAIVVTWPQPFPDANYSPSCNLIVWAAQPGTRFCDVLSSRCGDTAAVTWLLTVPVPEQQQ
jgi:hypothetical protein